MSFNALRITRTEAGFERSIAALKDSDLPAGDLSVAVHFSSLNYKDGLSSIGHPGVSRNFPHTPGVDAAGIVLQSGSDNWQPGDQVIVTGFDLGMNTAGGFAGCIRVPSEWAVPCRAGLACVNP